MTDGGGDGRGPKPPDRPDGRPGDRPPDGDQRGPRRAETAAITVNGAEVGTVYVPAEAPPVFVAVWQVGPTLAWFAIGMLGVGAAVTALTIFRPTHNRLRALEEAATALGQGRTDVRAVESGGDEVSSLARTFNRMASDLETRAKALGASDRARRQLLADVSHELMTPLTAIRGYTETLGMRDLGLDEPTRVRYLGIIGEETQKLEELIGDLLDLARLEGGGGTLAFKDVAVADLFGRVEDRHRPTVLDRQITLRTAVEPPDLAVQGDAQRLEQALQNLAANAIKHTPDGGAVELRATRHAGRHPPHGIRLRFRDPAGTPAARVRPVLQGRSVPHGERHVGQRPRPLDRPGDRRAARRHACRPRTPSRAERSSRSSCHFARTIAPPDAAAARRSRTPTRRRPRANEPEKRKGRAWWPSLF